MYMQLIGFVAGAAVGSGLGYGVTYWAKQKKVKAGQDPAQ